MTPEGYSHLFIAVLMGAASINAANAQVALAATQNPDGIYAVDISTRQGDCDKAYHWMISVSGVRRAGGGMIDDPAKDRKAMAARRAGARSNCRAQNFSAATSSGLLKSSCFR